MKAAVYYGRGDVRVENVPEPGEPGPGFATVKVRWCGICGSDLHEYQAGPIFIPTKPHPLTGRCAPVTLGHEFSGKVVAVGPGVDQVRAGDRVTADACWRCGDCYWCRRGEYNLCKRLGSTGLCADGAFAEYLTVPAYTLFKLPESVSDEVGALVEPLAVAFHALRRGGVAPGDTVAIVGAGPIGLCALLAARTIGAGRVLVVEPMPERQELARSLGAATVFDPRDAAVVRQVFHATDGIGPDVVVECVGRPETGPLAVELARRGGRVVIAGIYEQPSTLHFNRLVFYEKEVLGAIAYAGEFATVLALLADGRLKPEALITDQIGLEAIVPAGLDELIRNRGAHVKMLVTPAG